MSDYIVLKSKAVDFGGNWNQDNLATDITGNILLNTGFKGVLYSETQPDVISIIFASEPSVDAMNALDNIILNHNPIRIPPRIQYISGNSRVATVDSPNYYLILTINYPGFTKSLPINYVDITAYRDPGVTSYSLKIIDSNNMNIIAERTGLTNTQHQSICLGAIQNQPTTSILEVYAKRESTDNDAHIHVENVMVYYGN